MYLGRSKDDVELGSKDQDVRCEHHDDHKHGTDKKERFSEA